MRIRDILMMGRNVAENITFKLDASGPGFTVSGKELFDIHENDMQVQRCVSLAFNGHRIFWQDFAHEFKFVPGPGRRRIALDSATQVEAQILSSHDALSGAGPSELRLAQILLILRERVRTGVQALADVPDVDDYNKWVREIGDRSDELLTYDQQMANLTAGMRELRRQTFPVWQLLIDLLVDSEIKRTAEQNFRSGCQSVGLETSEVEGGFTATSTD